MGEEIKPPFGWDRLAALKNLREWGKDRYEGFRWKVKEVVGVLPDGETISHFPNLMKDPDLALYYHDWTKADFEWLLDELNKIEKKEDK